MPMQVKRRARTRLGGVHLGGGVPGADQAAVLSQGFLEGSNIDAVSELIGTMEDQRQFEINIKLISLSKEIDEGGSSLMRLPPQ